MLFCELFNELFSDDNSSFNDFRDVRDRVVASFLLFVRVDVDLRVSGSLYVPGNFLAYIKIITVNNF